MPLLRPELAAAIFRVASPATSSLPFTPTPPPLPLEATVGVESSQAGDLDFDYCAVYTYSTQAGDLDLTTRRWRG
ncbi:hypothetical protein L1987_13627 [Smallanthus sonchifolius]|uniref:Uncharacterized protein n=1 Tax=Smallanthus sonchifolius TaxID=185202 RepID=A0ACB9JKI1_9ASTR|nr:hypothetical protein L1987_13627 [Smallanthus sonchifolius]